MMQGDEAAREPLLKESLLRSIAELERALEEDTRNALAWMIADGLLDFKLAVPTGELDGGDFHDKFGVFTDQAGDRISFNGSYNDSQKGLRNYESLKVFTSWQAGTADWVQDDVDKFETLWANEDPNVRVYTLPDAAREAILKLRSAGRPYKLRSSISKDYSQSRFPLWKHQQTALDKFLQIKAGVAEMATGTGKTRLALAACESLIESGSVECVIVSTEGTDLLEQWYSELLELVRDRSPRWAAFRQFAGHKELDDFVIDPKRSVLLVSRAFLPAALRGLDPAIAKRTILIHDEVHGLGSPANRTALSGKSALIPFKLGLSATPDRAYDAAGNTFIDQEVGPIFFTFTLEDAIAGRVLAPFEYHPLAYTPDDDDARGVQAVYSKQAARKRDGSPMPQEEFWTELARVYKLSKAKLGPFRSFIPQRTDLLQRCIVFVETREYGDLVLPIVHDAHHEFHTYFADDQVDTLRRFARGDLECLITCHKLSEGIDIRSLTTVILFSSSRARLETVQRIGRCLRFDPTQPEKIAHVVDFIRDDTNDNADADRATWLQYLSTIRPVLTTP